MALAFLMLKGVFILFFFDLL